MGFLVLASGRNLWLAIIGRGLYDASRFVFILFPRPAFRLSSVLNGSCFSNEEVVWVLGAPPMKKQLLVGLVGFAFAASAIADIQDAPSTDYCPTRELGR